MIIMMLDNYIHIMMWSVVFWSTGHDRAGGHDLATWQHLSGPIIQRRHEPIIVSFFGKNGSFTNQKWLIHKYLETKNHLGWWIKQKIETICCFHKNKYTLGTGTGGSRKQILTFRTFLTAILSLKSWYCDPLELCQGPYIAPVLFGLPRCSQTSGELCHFKTGKFGCASHLLGCSKSEF